MSFNEFIGTVEKISSFDFIFLSSPFGDCSFIVPFACNDAIGDLIIKEFEPCGKLLFVTLNAYDKQLFDLLRK